MVDVKIATSKVISSTFKSLAFNEKKNIVKVTVHVGTDQNIVIEIFAEYKYTLNKLLVTKIVFQDV